MLHDLKVRHQSTAKRMCISMKGALKRSIRERIDRVARGLKFEEGPRKSVSGFDAGFADQCVSQIMSGSSYSVRDVADKLAVSEDWVLDHIVKTAAGVFRHGKVIRIPEAALKAAVRSMLTL